METPLPKIIVILGPTASGKTDLSLALARKYNGEIVSADSRQVYKKMKVATMKPDGEWQAVNGGKAYVVEGIPHYCVDIVDPGKELSVARFKTLAIQHIRNILKRGKTPFIVGGTGLYIWALVDNLNIPSVAPQKKLRASLEKKSLDDLSILLRNLDPETQALIDRRNKRRLIRALEVAIMTGEDFFKQRKKDPPLFEVLQIGLKFDRAELFSRIDHRADNFVAAGLIAETQALIKQKYGWNLPSMSGIGYRQMGYYLRGECSLTDAIAGIKNDTRHYAKRQMTWFRRDQRIRWIEPPGLEEKAERLIETFLS